MNRITRSLVVVGLGLGTALTVAAGPAQAAPAATQATTHTSVQTSGHWNDDEDVVGYFRTRMRCERVGRLGEFRDRWDDYDCTRVRIGHFRTAWALEVSDDDWNDDWDDDNWDDGWYHNWHGGDFTGGWLRLNSGNQGHVRF